MACKAPLFSKWNCAVRPINICATVQIYPRFTTTLLRHVPQYLYAMSVLSNVPKFDIWFTAYWKTESELKEFFLRFSQSDTSGMRKWRAVMIGSITKESLTKVAVIVSPGDATFGGCWIQSPKLCPHFGVSYRTGGTRVIRIFCSNSGGDGPDGTDFPCNMKYDEVYSTQILSQENNKIMSNE